jgi:WD40 repeat protein
VAALKKRWAAKKAAAVALTADGKRAVSGSDDTTLRVWDLQGNQPPRVLEGHTASVTAVALTTDGKGAVSGSRDYTLRVWDLEGHKPPHVLEGYTAAVLAVALTADGKRSVSGSRDYTLRAWDLESGNCLAVFTCDAPLFVAPGQAMELAEILNRMSASARSALDEILTVLQPGSKCCP